MNIPLYHLEFYIVALGTILLIVDAFVSLKNKDVLAYLGMAGVALAAVALPFLSREIPASNQEMTVFYAVDHWAVFYKGMALVSTLLVLMLAVMGKGSMTRYLATDGVDRDQGISELYALPILTCAGLMWMASAKNLIVLFCALELVTISFYILVAYLRRNIGSLEAGVKYLILGALSTGFLVYGIAWIYGATGSFQMDAVVGALRGEPSKPLIFGVSLVLIALAFKVGAVPMHIWIPDVYQGAPMPITAFLSVASKAAGVAVLLRFLHPFMESEGMGPKLASVFLVLAVATILLGNLAAIGQENVKRLLAYSSIANAGFLLLGMAAWPEGEGQLNVDQLLAFYLATYLVMTMGAFFVLSMVRLLRGGDKVHHFSGLAESHPQLALAATLILAALAGLPLTIGFWGKFLVFQAAVEQQLWWGVGVSFIGVAAGFYYYFKVIRSMFWGKVIDGADESVVLPKLGWAVVWTVVALVVVLGVWPQPVWWMVVR